MASLDQNPKNGRYYVRFRFAGKSFKRSLKTTSHEVADATKTRLEETLKLVQRGRVLIPDDADPVTFLLTDGKKNEQAKPKDVQTLGELFDAYLASLPPGSKEETTLEGEAIHRKHLLLILKKRCTLKSLNQQLLQNYINQRLTETYRKQLIRPATIRKEITTLRLMWNWGKDEGMVSTNLPT